MASVGQTTNATFVPTNFICEPSTPALALFPAIDRTGIVNFVCANCAKLFAVSGHESTPRVIFVRR